MNPIDEIKKHLPNDGSKSLQILQFSGFTILSELGHGHQGIVFKVRNKILKEFALKIYYPSDTDPNILKDGISRFKNEVQILSGINHKNIVRIFTAGTAKWNEEIKEWVVLEEFSQTDNQQNIIYFYIMNFINGKNLKKLFPIGDTRIRDDLRNFELLITQVCTALSYHHKIELTHKDIKLENIIFSVEDSNYIIVDYGFARKTNLPPYDSASTHPKVDYIDWASVRANKYELNDMGQFSRLLEDILPSFKHLYDIFRYNRILDLLKKGHHADLSSRFKDMDEFYQAIRENFLTSPSWNLQLRINEFLTPTGFGRFTSSIRLPVSGSVFITDEVKDIIDTIDFQRLRGIRQLGPTMFVYPSANHTRFEHSLGTYSLSLKYLQKLLTIPAFREICDPIDETIKIIVLTALLHDIGHYPYSHWVEEINQFPNDIKLDKHDKRGPEIINNGEIGQIIRNKWKINDLDFLFSCIDDSCSNTKGRVINSIINSIIDLDKLDYLKRDSIHCGVDYGKAIDEDRLLNSLYYKAKEDHISLTEKGKSVLHELITCRNIMYNQVYWHKTVRSCDAMFKRFFYKYIDDLCKKNRKMNGDQIKKEILNDILLFPDDKFINYLYKNTSTNKDYQKLLKPFAFEGRTIYKPLYIYEYSGNINEKEYIIKFFEKVQTARYKEIIELNKTLSLRLQDIAENIDEYDILIEKTPVKLGQDYNTISQFNFWNHRKNVIERVPQIIKDQNEYLKNNQRGFIFVHPKYYDKLVKHIQDEENFKNLLR